MVLPAQGFTPIAVTKSDTVADPGGPFRGISIGGAGILKITTVNDAVVTFASGDLAAGVIHPIYVKNVWNSTTTATAVFGYK